MTLNTTQPITYMLYICRSTQKKTVIFVPSQVTFKEVGIICWLFWAFNVLKNALSALQMSIVAPLKNLNFSFFSFFVIFWPARPRILFLAFYSSVRVTRMKSEALWACALMSQIWLKVLLWLKKDFLSIFLKITEKIKKFENKNKKKCFFERSFYVHLEVLAELYHGH